jgi:cyclophilin family peptidyl-prolyl cis-trans isomerase
MNGGLSIPTDRPIRLVARPSKIGPLPSDRLDAPSPGSVSEMSGAKDQDGERSIRRDALVAAFVTLLAIAGSMAASQVGRTTSIQVVGPPHGETSTTTLTGTIAATTAVSQTPTTTTTTTTSVAATTTTTTTLPPLPCPNADGSTTRVTSFATAPPVCVDVQATYRAKIETSAGTITVLLDPVGSPRATNNFVYLARYHFYDGLPFHRIVPGFVIQSGDPLGTGSGGPGYTFADELPRTPGYPIGALAMSNGNPNRPDSNGSQFFIVVGRSGEDLETLYPLFGRVTEGLAIAKLIGTFGDGQSSASPLPLVPAAIVRITIQAENERPDLGRLP